MEIILLKIVSFVFALGVIIVVHEAGHLLVAKSFGVRVLTFSVGFGRRIWGVQRGETEYRVSAVPLGGYVRLSGENPEEATNDPRDFLSKPRWQRILVYLAGPAMNVVLAIFIFAGLFMIGMEIPHLPDVPAIVGTVEPGSSAARAGITRGDRILAVNGKEVENWQQVLMALITSPAHSQVRIALEHDGHRLDKVVVPQELEKQGIRDTGGLSPLLRPQITRVFPDSPAEAAGLRVGDEVWSIDGLPVADSRDFVADIEKRAGQKVEFEIGRDGRPLRLTVTPRNENGVGKIGVGVGVYQKYGPLRAFSASVRYNVLIVQETISILGKVITGEVKAKSAFAGPLEIANQAGEAAQRSFKDLIYLMGFLSISIAFMNLLPIPILDGGQILILFIEEVIRRDLSLQVKEVVSQVGFFMILALMVTVIYFDVVKRLPAGLLPGS
jgi:regulator of sigma E protease